MTGPLGLTDPICIFDAVLRWFGKDPRESFSGYGPHGWIVPLTRDREVRDILHDLLFEIESGRMQPLRSGILQNISQSWKERLGDLPGKRDPRFTVVTMQALVKFAVARGEKPEFLAHLFAYPMEQPNSELTTERQELNAPVRNRGGRPTKYDWEAFYCEIIRLADTVDGLPERRTELATIMKDWCQKAWNAEPPDSLLREKIAKVYNVLPTKGH